MAVDIGFKKPAFAQTHFSPGNSFTPCSAARFHPLHARSSLNAQTLPSKPQSSSGHIAVGTVFFHTFLVWGWLDGKLSLERSIEKLLGTHHDESKHLCKNDGQACASAGSLRPCPSSELES
jgi:hypothetical protein